ncbi:hypothetical protein B9Z55_012652 [Caenorhabditis nigoni]|uniref:Uncharacterized protein n=1 Tax=Caenorhabditis nigoni TaxID=1611254 RepID=A0A2G5TY81_9PELO|nr:hypothetical protein B9Z55_012652 [Caenorhabditis nigoni]
MNSYPSSGSSFPSQMARPSNFSSNQVNMSLAPHNGPFQPAPMNMPVLQGSQVHHHHHHFYPQIGFEQMRMWVLSSPVYLGQRGLFWLV